MRHILLLTLAFLLSLPAVTSIAHAEDDAKKRPAILKVSNINKLESRGIFSSPAQGSLGRDMWSNGKRASIAALMAELPAVTENYALQRLRNGILLTSANTQLLRDKKPPKGNADIFTLRMENLLRIGAYDYAAKMYETLDQEPYHPRLAKAGLIALLLKGEKALACLEYQTVADRDFSDAAKTDSFWGDIALYCDYALKTDEDAKAAAKALSGASNSVLKNIGVNARYKTNYSRQRFEKLDLLSRALLKAEDRIIKTNLASLNFKDIPPHHIELLYNESDINDNPRTPFLLNLQRLRWGFTDALQVHSFVKRNKKALQTSSPTGWQRVPAFYKKLEEAREPKDKLAVFDAHLYLMKTYGTAAFLPVIKYLRETTKEDVSPAQKLALIRIYNHAGLSWPSKWNESVLENAKTTLNGKNSKRIFAVSVNNIGANKLKEEDIAYFNSILDINNVIQEETLKIVIEKLDKQLQSNHNHLKVYEKDALTSPVQSYPLPNTVLWNSLRKAGNDQSISEVLLLTTLIMHDLQGKKIYPGIMQDTFKSLNAVGLTNISKDLTNNLFLEE